MYSEKYKKGDFSDKIFIIDNKYISHWNYFKIEIYI